jgi:hypothetical protein
MIATAASPQRVEGAAADKGFPLLALTCEEVRAIHWLNETG